MLHWSVDRSDASVQRVNCGWTTTITGHDTDASLTRTVDDGERSTSQIVESFAADANRLLSCFTMVIFFSLNLNTVVGALFVILSYNSQLSSVNSCLSSRPLSYSSGPFYDVAATELCTCRRRTSFLWLLDTSLNTWPIHLFVWLHGQTIFFTIFNTLLLISFSNQSFSLKMWRMLDRRNSHAGLRWSV